MDIQQLRKEEKRIEKQLLHGDKKPSQDDLIRLVNQIKEFIENAVVKDWEEGFILFRKWKTLLEHYHGYYYSDNPKPGVNQ